MINWRNIAVLPIAFLVRAPILLLAYVLIDLGKLIEHKHCPDDANEWSLTPLGLAVRAYLEGERK